MWGMQSENDTRSDRSSFRDWLEANQACLEMQLSWLRLLLRRRVLWLRRQWKSEQQQGYPGLVITDAEADGLLTGETPVAERRFYGRILKRGRSHEASNTCRGVGEGVQGSGRQGDSDCPGWIEQEVQARPL